jgi:RND family efflux transporter MFP subunit
MYVDVGSSVTSGQLLAELEAPELDAQLKEAQSALHTKEAVYQGSKLTYDRLLRTSKIPGTISPNDLDNAYAKMSADSSDLMAARSRFDQAQAERQYLQVRAPFSGIISSRNVYPGAYVGPAGKGSDVPMLTLQEQTKLRLVIAVPEAAVKGLKLTDSIQFTVKPIPGRSFYARVSRMAGSMNTTLRTEQVEMDVNNSDKQLLPGMYAQVSINNSSPYPSFVIPNSAVTSNSQQVFVIGIKNRQAQWIPVQKGRSTTDSVEIYGQLMNGDTLAIRATEELRNGMTVHTQ